MVGMSDNMGFLVGDISRLIRRTFDERAKAIGITRPQWRVLTWLQRHEGINQSALADMLELDAMALCRMVDRLQAADMVERRADPADRRAWKLYLTSKGIALTEQLQPIGEELLQEALVDISPEDQDKMYHLLERFRTNLQSIDEDDSRAKRTARG
ncbi:multiple antibiotic resistance protein MarR [Sphingorhabdus sp. SMR4y]|nr:multiple antibiotic resistance protein MarR [Sphingorhabdus sp. SMR4y]